MPGKKPFVRRFGQVDFDSMIALPGAAADDADIFVTRRGEFGANRTLTRAQIIFGAGVVPDPLLLGDGAVGAPTYSFTSDPNTGVYREAADILGLAAGGVQIAQAKEVVGGNQFIVAPGVVQNVSATPSLGFGDGDTGLFESADDVLKFSIGSTSHWVMQTNVFQSETVSGPTLVDVAASATVPGFAFTNDLDTGIGRAGVNQLSLIAGGGAATWDGSNLTVPFVNSRVIVGRTSIETISGTWTFSASGNAIQVSNSQGGAIRNVSGQPGPSLLPDKTQIDLGIGSNGTNGLTLVTAGFNAAIYVQTSGGIRFQSNTNINITASATQTQGQAQLVGSYNEVRNVASDNNVVTLMTARAGQHQVVINSSANILQVFPSSGDDLGNGLNISTTIPAGQAKYFLAHDVTTYHTIAGTPVNNSGPTLLNEVSSNTNPTLIPNNQAPSSGLGGIAGQPSLIANGQSGMSVSEAAGAAKIGFYDGSPIALQTGVAVTTAAIHAALVSLRLITA